MVVAILSSKSSSLVFRLSSDKKRMLECGSSVTALVLMKENRLKLVIPSVYEGNIAINEPRVILY